MTCGEALVDLVPDQIGGEAVYRPVLGGSLFNVALGIARLGGTAGYLWELSSDALGQRLMAALAGEGVDTSGVRVSQRATPVAVVDLSGSEPRYAIADPDQIMVDTSPPPVPATATCLVVGSAVLAREPVAAAVEERAREAPVVAIDYNVRAPSIVDPDSYRKRLERLSRCGGVVKVSEADLVGLGRSDAEGVVTELVCGGAALAVLTRGSDGAVVFSAGGSRVAVPSVAARVVDPVGAGDAFMAGMLTWLQARGALSTKALAALTEADLRTLLTYAQNVAAVTCAARGAVMPFKRDLAGSGVVDLSDQGAGWN